MRFQETEVSSVHDLIGSLKVHAAELGTNQRWYRGQDNIAWSLTPSISRAGPDPAKREYELLKKFRQMAPRLVELQPRDDWEWLFLMQHYGVPTRLLDWSESPLIALYFSVYENTYDNEDGALWALLPETLNRQTGWSELQDQAGIPFFGMDTQLDAYLTSNIVQTPSGSGSGPIAAIAPRASARIAAQLGTFTVFHSDLSPLEQVGDGSHCWKYKIPRQAKGRLREELSALQINEFALFPELDKISRVIR